MPFVCAYELGELGSLQVEGEKWGPQQAPFSVTSEGDVHLSRSPTNKATRATMAKFFTGAILMNPTYWLVLAFSLTILPALRAEKIDNRNFAIDTCFPTAHEIQLAEGRTRAYWTKHASCFGTEPRFLAVETSKIFPGDVQDLYPKLIYSETTASFVGRGDHKGSYSELDLHGIMIYDTKARQFVSNQGYISVDTPPRGGVVRFGPYIARYIGWG